MTKTPLILGSGERSATKGFGMRKVTKFQETSVVTLGFQLPTPTCKSVWHLSPTSTTRGPFLQSCHNFLLSSPHIFSRAFPPHPCPVRGLAGSTLTQSLLCHNPVPSHISQARYPGHGKTCQEKTFQNQARGGKVCQHLPPLPFVINLHVGKAEQSQILSVGILFSCGSFSHITIHLRFPFEIIWFFSSPLS